MKCLLLLKRYGVPVRILLRYIETFQTTPQTERIEGTKMLDLFWLFNYLHLFFIKLICGKFKNEIKKN
jgi:hypothetical protein